VIVFTKIDKVKGQDYMVNIENIKSALLEHWEELPQCFVTSSEKKLGRDELLEFITISLSKRLERRFLSAS